MIPSPPECTACRLGAQHTAAAHHTFRLTLAVDALDGLTAVALGRLTLDAVERCGGQTWSALSGVTRQGLIAQAWLATVEPDPPQPP